MGIKSMGQAVAACMLMGFSWLVTAGPAIQHWASDTGADVYFVPANDLPLLDVKILFRAGGVYDGDKPGLASMTSLLLDKGAGNWDAGQIAARLEGVGASLGVASAKDSASVSLRVLTDPAILETAITTVTEVLGNPVFAEADFQREKARVMQALQQREESPGALASLAYKKALYGDHPYGIPANGYIDTVRTIERQDLMEFYRDYYVAANATVSIVGDLNRDQAEQLVQRLLSGLEKGSRAPLAPEVTLPAKATESRQEFPSAQTHIFSGMPVMAHSDPDYFPLYVGNHILGGSGLTSLIVDEVREKRGLSYSAYSYFSLMARKGPFTMGLQTRNDQAGQALEVLRQTLRDFMAKGPTAEQLEAAKKNITGGFVLRYDSNDKIADYVAMIGFYGLPLDYLDTFNDQVTAVTVEDIVQAFGRRVDPQRFQTILVGGSAEAP